MSERTFAAWVEPVAEAPRKSRGEVVAFARSLSPDAWSESSPLDGWTYKDLLAHLAGGSGKLFHGILRSVIAAEPLDPAILSAGDDIDEINEREVVKRRDWSVEELIAEIEADTETFDELLSQLTEEQKDLRQDGFPMSLGEALSNDPGGHFREHLAQLRTAREA